MCTIVQWYPRTSELEPLPKAYNVLVLDTGLCAGYIHGTIVPGSACDRYQDMDNRSGNIEIIYNKKRFNSNEVLLDLHSL